MKYFVFLLALIPSLALAADENLFRNSDMDSTAAWKGDKGFHTLNGNKVLEIKANPNREVSFNQVADTRKVKDIQLTLRYITSDYQGRGFQIKGVRADATWTFYDFELIADGQWHEIPLKFSEVNGSRQVDFKFVVKDGTGTVYFDDIVAFPK